MNSNTEPARSHPKPPRRVRWISRRTILITFAVVCVTGVAVAPSTRPIVRVQARYALPFAPEALFADIRGVAGVIEAGREAALLRAAQAYPEDAAVQVAYAVMTKPNQGPAALRPLLTRFDNDPTVHAAFLLYALRSEKAGAPIEEVLRVALRGARLEPDNAFFPAMRAVALKEPGDRAGLVAALHDAGRASRWDDHTRAMVEGLWRLHNGQWRLRSEYQVDSRARVPLRALAAVAVRAQDARSLAAAFERAGRVDDGIRLRLSLMRLGDRMRAQSSMLVTAQFGMRVSDIAIERLADPEMYPPTNTDRQAIRATERERFIEYLARHGHARDAAWAKGRFAAWDASIGIAHEGPASLDTVRLLWRLMALQSLGVALLGGAFWLLTLGGAATLATRGAEYREGQPLPRSTRRGTILGAICAALFVPLAVDELPSAITLLLIVSTVALLLGRKRPGPRAFGGTLLFLVAPIALLGSVGHAAVRARGTEGITGVSPTVLAAVSHGVLGLIVPLVATLALALVAIVRRVPVSVGVVRGLARTAVPTVAVLGILYAGSAVVTAQSDAHMSWVLARQTEHEGRFYAETLGRTWPE